MDIQCFSSFPGERSPGISLYYTHIGGLLSLPGLCLLTPERRERLFRYRRPRDRARCLAAGLLMRRMHEGEPEKGRYGKPYFPDGPAFSLSHAGDYVILACSSRDVGTDIEPHRPYDPRVARRCFTEAERRWMERQEDDTGAF